jgi:hypothetical protein
MFERLFDINTIRAWLGHVSLATTNVYAEVDLGMKAKALSGRRSSPARTGSPRAVTDPKHPQTRT